MKAAFASLLAAALLAVGGCRVHDVRVVVVKAPGVRCAACGERVKKSLSGLEGVKADKLAFDFAAGTVAVTYDSMLVAIKNIEFAVAAAGYTVNAEPYTLPADPAAAAALPAECREHIR